MKSFKNHLNEYNLVSQSRKVTEAIVQIQNELEVWYSSTQEFINDLSDDVDMHGSSQAVQLYKEHNKLMDDADALVSKIKKFDNKVRNTFAKK